jgi:peptide/nickel transport system permease protein
MPPFVSAVLLQVFFAVTLTSLLELETPLLPVAGMYPPGQTEFDLWLRVKHMILPVTVVAIQIIAVYSQVMRASLLDVKESEYMRTARSKGISEKRVIIRHAIRNALIPIATLAALQFGAIVGGLIITERIFEYKGTGDYLITALGNGDFPQVMPLMFIVVASVILFNLLADISYAWLDPRIRLD